MLSQPISMIGIPQTSSCGTLQTRTSRNCLHSKARERDRVHLWLARPCMIGFSHQPWVLTLNGFLRQQLKRLENCAQRDDSRFCKMSPTMKALTVVFDGMAVMVVTTVCGAATGIALAIDDEPGQYALNWLMSVFWGGVIGAVVGVPVSYTHLTLPTKA